MIVIEAVEVHVMLKTFVAVKHCSRTNIRKFRFCKATHLRINVYCIKSTIEYQYVNIKYNNVFRMHFIR